MKFELKRDAVQVKSKTFFSKIIFYGAIWEIGSLIFPAGILAPQAFAETSTAHAPTADCDAACQAKKGCDSYQAFVDEIDKGKSCCGGEAGKVASYLTTHPVSCKDVLYDGTAEKTFEKCRNTELLTYAELGSHCTAKNFDEKARDFDQALAITWTVVTAACLAACVNTFTEWATGGALALTCTGLNLGATAADISTSVIIVEDAGKAKINLPAMQAAGSFGGLFGGVGVVGAGVGVVGGLALAKETGMKATQAVSESLGQSAFTKILACGTFGLSTVIMSLKWANFVVNRDNALSEGKVVSTLKWPSDFKPAPTAAPTTPSGSGGRNLGPNLGAGTSGITNQVGPSDAELADMSQNFPGAQFSAAAADGPMGKLMDAFPNKKDFPKILDSLRINLGDLRQKLQTNSPSSVLGGMMSMPAEAKDYLDAIQNLAADGKLQIEGDASVMKGGGKGASGGSSPGDGGFNPMSLFGPKASAATATTGAVDFGAKTPLSAGDGSDIWHSGAKASIFQIVSKKLVNSTPRISPLEWSTPLNRALNGLPSEVKTGKH